MRWTKNLPYKYLRPFLFGILFVLSLVLLNVAFEAVAPLPFKLLIDNVLGGETLDKSTFLGRMLSLFSSRESLALFTVFSFFLTTLAGSVITYFVSIYTKGLSRKVVFNFSQNAFDNLGRLAIGHLKKRQIGDYVYRLSYDVWALGDLLEIGLVPTVTNALYLISTIFILFLISPKLTFIALGMVPILALGLIIFNKRIGTETKRSEISNSTLFSFIQEVLSQLKTIQAYNQETRESHEFERKEDSSLVNDLNVYGLGIFLDLLIGATIAIGYSIIILFGIRDVFSGTITTGLLIIFLFYLDNLTNPLLTFLNSATSLKENYIKICRMEDFFNKKSQVSDTGKLSSVESSEIIFDNVSIHGDAGHPILENVSFKIPQGKKTIIVGVSGSGKTTIASTILRFTNISAGRVTIGGKDLCDYSIKTLRDNISYLPQEIMLFHDTIFNNITFGNPSASLEELKRATKLAVCDFIDGLPEKYEFNVGEEGMNLSGGQKQRIMLARAFIKSETPMLIFDEPLSSLDVNTRQTVMQNINKFSKGKTAIIISNVSDVISQADNIIVVNEGKIIHSGHNLELLRTLV